MTPLQQMISDNEREFEEKFKCINAVIGCDSKGNIPVQVSEGEWEAEQCEYCFERLFKYQSFLHSSQLRLIEEVKKMCEGKKKEYRDFPNGYNSDKEIAYNQALDDIISTLEEVK